MLWQHDPARPIGVWDEVREDARGLFVRGWLRSRCGRRERAAAEGGGAIDGLSIGTGWYTRGTIAAGQRLLGGWSSGRCRW